MSGLANQPCSLELFDLTDRFSFINSSEL